jgi:hypothetical protein
VIDILAIKGADGVDGSDYVITDADYQAIAEIVIGRIGSPETPSVDLSDYYTKEQTDTAIENAIGSINIPTVPTNVSAFTNDAGYLTSHQSLAGYAKTTDIPDVSGFLTEEQVLALIQANMPTNGDEVSY